MKPTISNAFNNGTAGRQDPQPPRTMPAKATPVGDTWELRKPADEQPRRAAKKRDNSSVQTLLTPMQVDLRETEFGWSLELTPITAIDALDAMQSQSPAAQATPAATESPTFLVSMEQSAWRNGDDEMPLCEIAQRLSIAAIETISADQLVMDGASLRQLVSLCQPTRLLVVQVDGSIDAADARAMTKAIDSGRSPLLAELRAVAALEVLGDRSIVLHCRQRSQAERVVAENFRHYLAAISGRPAMQFESPQDWQVERLLGCTGALTVRPIETQVFSTSIDVGINTSAKERFTRPADRSLIYDLPSNTWHDEA